MTQNDLSRLFPSVCGMEGLVLLVPPTEFYKLEGCTIDGSRVFMLVCRGSLYLKQNDKQYEMKAHSFLDMLDTMTIRMERFSTDLRAWCLFITFEFASESLKNLRPGPMNHLLERISIPIHRFSLEECELLERQLIQLRDTLGNRKHYYRQELTETYFRSFSLELGNIMFTHETDTNGSNSYASKRDFIMLNFMRLLAMHFASEHRIEFYAKSLGVSTKHLTRIIKEMTGKTPHAVISDEITHQAMSMLEDERIPVGQIAEALHFSDQSAFCKFFKKQKKISPMAYRRRTGN